MAGIQCASPGCLYNTDTQVPPDSDVTNMIALLQIHTQIAHPVAAAPQAAPGHQPTQKLKLEPPRLSAGSDQETWELFLRSWTMYKTGMNIANTQSSVYLFNCLEPDLRADILRANPSTQISDMSEDDLTAAIKTLAVKVESKLVHRIRMGQSTQTPGHSIRNFYAVLKGQAKLCQFRVTCPSPTCNTMVDYSEEVIMDQLIRGIYDKEILSDLLGEVQTDMPLPQVVDYIARKEQAKSEQGTVSYEQTNAALQTPMRSSTCSACQPIEQSNEAQQTPARSPTCWACQGPSHGPNTIRTRKAKCPAWDAKCIRCSATGHYSSACSRCPQCNNWGHKSSRSKKCTHYEGDEDQTGGAMYITGISQGQRDNPAPQRRLKAKKRLKSLKYTDQTAGASYTTSSLNTPDTFLELCGVSDQTAGASYTTTLWSIDHNDISPQFPTPLAAQQTHSSVAAQREGEVVIPPDDIPEPMSIPMSESMSENMSDTMSETLSQPEPAQDTPCYPPFTYPDTYNGSYSACHAVYPVPYTVTTLGTHYPYPTVPTADQSTVPGYFSSQSPGVYYATQSHQQLVPAPPLDQLVPAIPHEDATLTYDLRQALTDLHCISPQLPTPLAAKRPLYSAVVKGEDEVEIPQVVVNEASKQNDMSRQSEAASTSVANCSSPPRTDIVHPVTDVGVHKGVSNFHTSDRDAIKVLTPTSHTDSATQFKPSLGESVCHSYDHDTSTNWASELTSHILDAYALKARAAYLDEQIKILKMYHESTFFDYTRHLHTEVAAHPMRQADVSVSSISSDDEDNNALPPLTTLPAQPFPNQPIPVQHAPSVQQYEEPVHVQGTYPPSSPPAPAASSPEPHRTPAASSPVPAQRPQRIRNPNSMLSSDIWDLSSLVEDSPALSSKQVAELLRFLASKVENADISLRHPESQTCPEGGR